MKDPLLDTKFLRLLQNFFHIDDKISLLLHLNILIVVFFKNRLSNTIFHTGQSI